MSPASTQPHDQEKNRLLLVTGATGYVGGRLVSRLLEGGYRVRVLARDPARLQGRPWLDHVEVAAGDVLQPETLPAAMQGVTEAYYLIHSMKGGEGFHSRDLEAARNFSAAAQAAGVGRILYLGGLGEDDADLSPHLRSRHETGEALRSAGVPVTEFRAGIIVGSGSVSFEMIRYLTERIPIMICPRWVYTRTQPIAIDDVLNYLITALEAPKSAGQTIEIGGAEVLTYGEMMLGYAAARGLSRRLIPVPVLTPRLSAYWVHWMTPIPAAIARPLIEGMRNEVIVRDDVARQLFPDLAPIPYRQAVEQALVHLQAGEVETAWSDALVTSQDDLPPVVLTVKEGIIIERRQRTVAATPEGVFAAFSSLGGEQGWLYADWAWRLRGELDRLIGGVGFRRGRRSQDTVRIGDAIDFWRVEAVEPPRLLRLRAEMRLPGRAWLQFETEPAGSGSTRLVQQAFFASKGLLGLLYWVVLYPIHALIFSGLIHALARRSIRLSDGAR